MAAGANQRPGEREQMRTESLNQDARAYWRNDLRGEMNFIVNYNLCRHYGIEGLSLSPVVISVRRPNYDEDKDPYEPCFITRERFDELVEHEKRFGRVSRIAEDDRQISGVDLRRDNSWPFCRDCLLPFTTMLQGDIGTRGCWVTRIEAGAELCECCWLAAHYCGDREAMIQHVLDQDMGDDRRLIRAELRRGFDRAAIIYRHSRDFWTSPGLRELIRLHRVSLTECAGVILRILRTLITEVKADERERNSRRATVSKTVCSSGSGTRAECYA
jgi:hypothetical protein